MEDGEALVVFGVHTVILPTGGVVVDMRNLKASAGQRIVPSYVLAVFQQIIFVAVALVVYDVGFAVV